MAPNLLSSLYHEIIQADQMQKGFKSLLMLLLLLYFLLLLLQGA